MAHYVTSIRSPRTVDDAFAYMADLRNFAEWDPGVRKVAQVEGDGAGLGAAFDVTVASVGSDLTLRYRTEEFDPSTNIFVVASTWWMSSEDRVTIAADPAGCVVTYDATLRLSGPLALGDPLLKMSFDKIGGRAAEGLRRVLDGEFVK